MIIHSFYVFMHLPFVALREKNPIGGYFTAKLFLSSAFCYLYVEVVLLALSADRRGSQSEEERSDELEETQRERNGSEGGQWHNVLD